MLSAEDSPFVTLPDIARYYRVVASNLLPDHSSHTAAVVVCLPSFEPEWALRLHGTDRRGYTISVSKPETQLWGIQDESAEVSILRHSLDISHTFADLLTNALSKALLTVANANGPTNGCDGVSYHFVARHRQHGRISGQAWMPRPTSIVGRIIEITERLCNFVCSESSAGSSVDSLAEELHSIVALPKYDCVDTELAAVKEETKKVVEHYRRNLITLEEMATELNRTFQYWGLPNPVDLLQLTDELPVDAFDKLR